MIEINCIDFNNVELTDNRPAVLYQDSETAIAKQKLYRKIKELDNGNEILQNYILTPLYAVVKEQTTAPMIDSVMKDASDYQGAMPLTITVLSINKGNCFYKIDPININTVLVEYNLDENRLSALVTDDKVDFRIQGGEDIGLKTLYRGDILNFEIAYMEDIKDYKLLLSIKTNLITVIDLEVVASLGVKYDNKHKFRVVDTFKKLPSLTSEFEEQNVDLFTANVKTKCIYTGDNEKIIKLFKIEDKVSEDLFVYLDNLNNNFVINHEVIPLEEIVSEMKDNKLHIFEMVPID